MPQVNQHSLPADTHPTVSDWAWLTVLILLWGSAFALIAIALRSFAPLDIAFGRLMVGAVAMLALNLAQRKPIPTDGRRWAAYGVIAVMGNALPFFLVSWGQLGVPSGVAGILMAMMPLVVVGLAHFFVPGERLGPRKATGFALGFIGVAVLTGPALFGLVPRSEQQLASQLALLGAACCYGVAVIVARRAPSSDPVTSTACVLLLAAVLSGAVRAISGPPWPAGVSLESAGALVTLGALCTAFATWVYFHIIRSAGATFLSLINYVIPVWAVALGALLLGERPHPRAFVALALILIGVLVSQRRRPRPK